MNAFAKRKAGFSLVELLVVLVILALLAAATLPSLASYSQQSRETIAIQECGSALHAAQAKAVQLWADSQLSELPLCFNEICATAGLTGSFAFMEASSEGIVTRLQYTAASGLVVEYDAAQNPKFFIVSQPGSGGGSITPAQQANTYLESCIQLTQQYTTETAQRYPDRKDTIAYVQNAQGLLPVHSSYTQNTAFADESLYWRPYYLGSSSSPHMILFAAPGETGHANWAAKLILIDSTVYVAQGKAQNISGLYTCQTTQAAQAWATANGFSPAVS